MPSPTHTCFGLTHHQDSAQWYTWPLHAPSRSPLHQLHTTGQHYGNHATTLCKCSSALYLTCAWFHLFAPDHIQEAVNIMELVIWSTHRLYCCSMWWWGLSCGHGPRWAFFIHIKTGDSCIIPSLPKSWCNDQLEGGRVKSHSGNVSSVILAVVEPLPWCVYLGVGK